MLYLIGYMVFGYLCICGFLMAHLYLAEKNGYDAVKWWLEQQDEGTIDVSIDGNFFVGLLIWPVRLMQFIFITMPQLYDTYDLKD